MKKCTVFLQVVLFLTFSFTASSQIIFEEDFEGSGTALPTGWTQETQASDGGWKRGTNLGSQYLPIPAHTKYIATNDDVCNCNKANERLITPVFSLAGQSAALLELELLYNDVTYTNTGDNEDFDIEISTDNGTTWTNLFTATGSASWQSLAIDLSAYLGQSQVKLGFKYNDNGGWTDGAAIDDLIVFNPTGTLDAELTGLAPTGFLLPSAAVPVVFTVKSKGDTLNAITLSYQINGGTIFSDTVSGFNLLFNNTSAFTHSILANFATTGNHILKAWTSLPNGQPDVLNGNDTLAVAVSVNNMSDVQLEDIHIADEVPTTKPVTVPFLIKNTGVVSINTLVLNYAIDNGTIFKDTVSGFTLAKGKTSYFSHQTKANFSVPGDRMLKIWISDANGVQDANTMNDTIAKLVHAEPVTVILYEDFEADTAGLPFGWSQQTQATDGGWKTGTNLGSQFLSIPPHTKYVATNDNVCNCNKANDRLISPAFSLAGYSFAFLEMSYYHETSFGESMKVQISTDGGSTWTDVFDCLGV